MTSYDNYVRKQLKNKGMDSSIVETVYLKLKINFSLEIIVI